MNASESANLSLPMQPSEATPLSEDVTRLAHSDTRFAAVVTALYIGLVAIGASHHEMWRDEVRALSIATTTDTLAALLTELRYEGHPSLWYLVLRAAHAVIGHAAVLPIASAAISTAAVWLFARHAPFGRPVRFLFPLGYFPLYEYSVVCRNYGLSMLLLFAYAVHRPRRSEAPIIGGLLLALLANASVHSAVLAVALTAAWLAEVARAGDGVRRSSRQGTGIAIALVGILVSALSVRPVPDTVATSALERPLGELLRQVVVAMRSPGRFFHEGFVPLWPLGAPTPLGFSIADAIATLLLLGALFVLRRHGSALLALLITTVGLTALFSAIYPGQARHQGLLFVFLVALLWQHAPSAESSQSQRRSWRALSIGLILLQLSGPAMLYLDVTSGMSSSRRLAEWITIRPELARVVIITEPDHLAEPLHYYLDARTFSIRANGMRRWTRFTKEHSGQLTLGELTDAALSLANRERAPVLVLIGHEFSVMDGAYPLDASRGSFRSGYANRFSWTPQERSRFLSVARHVARFGGALRDENYDAYMLPARH